MLDERTDSRRRPLSSSLCSAVVGIAALGLLLPALRAQAHELLMITVAGEDPVTGEETSRVVPIVKADRHLSPIPTDLDFGEVEAGFSSVLELRLQNIDPHGDTLEVSVVPSLPAPSSLTVVTEGGGAPTFELGPGHERRLLVTYSPADPQDHLESGLIVTSRELGGRFDETLEVTVAGTAFGVPRLRLLPAGGSAELTSLSLNFGTATPGPGELRRSFRLKNVGSAATPTPTTEVGRIQGLSVLPGLAGLACATVNGNDKCFWHAGSTQPLRFYQLEPGEEIPIDVSWTPTEEEAFGFAVTFPGGDDAVPSLSVHGTATTEDPVPPPLPGSQLTLTNLAGVPISSIELEQGFHSETVEVAFELRSTGTAPILHGRLGGVNANGCIEIHGTDKCFYDADYAPLRGFELAPGEVRRVLLAWSPVSWEPTFQLRVDFLGAANEPVPLDLLHFVLDDRAIDVGDDSEIRAYPDDFGGIRGLLNENAFFSDTDIDHVNLANGNLTVTIPIGGAFRIGPGFDYGLTLVHNSNAWNVRNVGDFDSRDNLLADKQVTIPNETNAGLGWTLSLGGELYIDPAYFGGGVLNWPNRLGHKWLYVDASGGAHAIGNTTSRIRVREIGGNPPSRAEVELPSGLVQTFVRTGEACRKDDGGAFDRCYRLSSIEDPFGNRVTFTYAYTPGGLQVTVNLDDAPGGRTIRVGYTKRSYNYIPGTDPVTNEPFVRDLYIADSVTLPTAEGEGVWALINSDETISRRCELHETLAPIDAYNQVKVPILEALVLPETSAGRYTFTTDTSSFDNCNWSAGALWSIETPSHGRIAYEYGPIDVPAGCSRIGSAGDDYPDVTELRGVFKRTVEDHRGTPLSTQSFSIELYDRPTEVIAAGPDCNRGRTMQATVAHWPAIPGSERFRVERRYHTLIETTSGLPESPSDPEYGDWDLRDHGLPVWKLHDKSLYSAFDEGLPAASRERLYLSTEVAECPTANAGVEDLAEDCTLRERTYRSYAYKTGYVHCDEAFKDTDCPIDEQILRGERQEFIEDDDNGSPVEVESWIEKRHRGYDGFGHFRRTDTRSSPGGLETYEVTFYNAPQSEVPLDTATMELGALPGSHPSGGWILDLFSYTESNPDGLARRTDFDFDPATGFLCSQRVRIEAGLVGEDDLVTAFADVDGDGFPEWEGRAGGDFHDGSSLGGCPSDPSDVAFLNDYEFRIRRTYQHGVLASRRYYRTTSAPIGPFLVDNTIDVTGAVAESCDHSVETVLCVEHSYDDVGRLTRTAPVEAGRAPTTTIDYTLDDAGGEIEVVQTGASAADVLARQLHRYDELGREVWIEKRVSAERAPSGWVAQERRYYPRGELRSVSAILDRDELEDLDGGERQPWRYRYDKYDYEGRPLRFETPAGERTTWSYTGFHRRQIDKGGALAVDQRLDHLGRPTEIREGAPGSTYRTTSYGYADGAETAERVDPDRDATQTRVRTIDARGFLVAESLPEKDGPVTYRHDSMGNRVRSSDNGNSLRYAYDEAGRLLRVRKADDSDWRWTEMSYHPTTGRLESATRYNYLTLENTEGFANFLLDSPGNTHVFTVKDTFKYDDRGNVKSKETAIQDYELPSGGPANAQLMALFEQDWTYDLLGRMRTARAPRCPTGTPAGPLCADFVDARELGTRYTYRFGELEKVEVTDEPWKGSPSYLPLAELGYHPSGMTARIDRYSETGAGIGGDTIAEQPLGSGATMPRIGSIEVRDAAGQTLWQSSAYRYNSLGKIEKIGATSYAYDAVGRLVQAGSLSYAYDRFDNLLSRVHPAIGSIVVDPATNRLESVHLGGLQPVAYDARGNLRSVECLRAHYDALDKMIAWACVTPTEGVPFTYQSIFLYAADGSRVVVFDRVANAADPRDNVVGTNLVTITGLNQETTREFRSGDDTETGGQSTGFKTYVDKLAIFREGSDGVTSTDWELTHLSHDHLGSLVLAWNQNTANADAYNPWGVKVDGHADLIHEAPAFAGHVSDRNGPTTDLPRDGAGLTTYMKARTYVQALGRFLQVDPGRDGWNMYAYAGGDPINRVDPDGQRGVGVEWRQVEHLGPVGMFIWLVAGKKSPLAKLEKAGFLTFSLPLVAAGGFFVDLAAFAPFRLASLPFTKQFENEMFGGVALPMTDTIVHISPALFDLIVGTDLTAEMQANTEASPLTKEAFEAMMKMLEESDRREKEAVEQRERERREQEGALTIDKIRAEMFIRRMFTRR